MNKISKYHRNQPFPSLLELYNSSEIEGILTQIKEKKDLLRKFGMNINLAPVVDVSWDASDNVCSRRLGKLPNETAEYIKKDVEGYVNDNFTCVISIFLIWKQYKYSYRKSDRTKIFLNHS